MRPTFCRQRATISLLLIVRTASVDQFDFDAARVAAPPDVGRSCPATAAENDLRADHAVRRQADRLPSLA